MLRLVSAVEHIVAAAGADIVVPAVAVNGVGTVGDPVTHRVSKTHAHELAGVRPINWAIAIFAVNRVDVIYMLEDTDMEEIRAASVLAGIAVRAIIAGILVCQLQVADRRREYHAIAACQNMVEIVVASLLDFRFLRVALLPQREMNDGGRRFLRM